MYPEGSLKGYFYSLQRDLISELMFLMDYRTEFQLLSRPEARVQEMLLHCSLTWHLQLTRNGLQNLRIQVQGQKWSISMQDSLEKYLNKVILCGKLIVTDENVDEEPTKRGIIASLQVINLVYCHKILICSLKIKAGYLSFPLKQWKVVSHSSFPYRTYPSRIRLF